MQSRGTRAEYVRIPLADGTLVATPELPADDLVPSLLAASDVLGTGWFGAVGLLAVRAAMQLGAERIVVFSRREPRQQLAWEFGATDIVTTRGDEGAPRSRSSRTASVRTR
jgi:threonine dehydrogenase-like Zn-dependent dehydrogenase